MSADKISLNQKSFITDFQEDIIVFSPGRINLIGEHTDYNNGFVLPTAIDKKITFRLKKNNSKTICNIYSARYDSYLQINLNHINKSDIEWENYLLGVLFELVSKTDQIKGFDCIIESDLPSGSGISSSAALECGLACGLNALFKLELSKETLIIASRDAEHNFVGTKCGIMDQFASVMSKKDHVLLLDCQSLIPEWIPFELGDYKILLLNTNVTHNLAESEYNTRRKECEQGIHIIQKKYPHIRSLRDVSISMLSEFKNNLSPIVFKRCQYIIYENKRVLDAAVALKTGNLDVFGKLMYSAHEGQQNEYEISCPELDFLVDFSKKDERVIGSRMMGGGFGGCTINIIHKSAIKNYIYKVSKAYEKAFKIKLDAFEVKPSEGTIIEEIL